jgi:transcriptional regulator GlxA family with amidase domain
MAQKSPRVSLAGARTHATIATEVRAVISRLEIEARPPHRVVMVGFPDAQILDITGPLEVFSRASRWLREHASLTTDAYRVELVASAAGPLRTSGGLQLVATRAYPDVHDAQTLLVAGGIGYRAAAQDDVLLEWLRRQLPRVERMGSICTGAFILAQAGLLRRRNATTHWAYVDRLASSEPTAQIASDCLYTQSGKVYTSAGVTAGMDLALAMVESDWGRAVALAVAQELVLFAKRSGGQAQISRQLIAQKKGGDRIAALELWILDHLDADLSVSSLARRARMSARQLMRRFAATAGDTPARYVLQRRLEAVRRDLEETDLPLKAIAHRTGFHSEQSMRRAFARAHGAPPERYRAQRVQMQPPHRPGVSKRSRTDRAPSRRTAARSRTAARRR